MITVGVDAHKRVHVAVALDEQGRELEGWRGTNSERGESFAQWLQGLANERRVGIEGAWGDGRGLARYLVTHGELAIDVSATARASSCSVLSDFRALLLPAAVQRALTSNTTLKVSCRLQWTTRQRYSICSQPHGIVRHDETTDRRFGRVLAHISLSPLPGSAPQPRPGQ